MSKKKRTRRFNSEMDDSIGEGTSLLDSMSLHTESETPSLDLSARIALRRSPLRVSLQMGRGPAAHEMAASFGGEFSDATEVGLRIFDVDMNPAMVRNEDMFLVLERLGPGAADSEERYWVELLIEGVEGPAVRAENWLEWDDY